VTLSRGPLYQAFPPFALLVLSHRRRGSTETRKALCQFLLLREEKEADVADGRPVRQLQMLHPQVKRPPHRLPRQGVKHLGGKLVGLTASFTRYRVEKPQVSRAELPLQQLTGHHHALDLVGALVDLGDRGPGGSFRR
jgi:hypothetical protein